ncbi:MAG: polyprenyl synthetase family protein [Planctomycetota bacterium]
MPATRAQREALRKRCEATAAKLDKSNPLDKQAMEQVARKLLKEAGEPESYLGWIMVVLASEFWRDQVAAVPPERRLLLLPHCLKHAEGCPADYDEFGLDCRRCGACSIADYRTVAEDMGYKVLVAEGSPIVMKIIVSGYIDAIVGVACLNVLEKAIDKVLLAGIPCMAVPLLSSDCRNTSVDEEWVSEFIQLRQDTPTESTRTYLHLLRASKNLFEPEVLERVLPRRRRPAGIQPEQQPDQQPDQKPEQAAAEPAAADPPTGLDPIVVTEQLAYDFLSRGGKYSRPFITLAAYDAMRGGDATKTDGAAAAEKLGDSVRRVALSIEAFHKASLIHDDIQDDDDFRYGEPTLHRQHGVGTAINVGDYLIGLGYQMVARDAAAISPEAVADILHQLSEAHTRLCEGQGAELLWRDREDKRLTTLDALKIYALKTSPAFQAALYGGVRLAGDAAELAEPIHQFSKHLGVAFQILNDLKDWRGDADNKLVAGGDVLSGRPTVLLALAFAALDEADTQELLALVQTRKGATPPADTLERVRRLYKKAGVFETADRLVDKHQERAEQIADELPVDDLRRLAYYLIDSVLERGEEQTPQLVEMARLDAKGVNANALNAGGLDARALDAKANA